MTVDNQRPAISGGSFREAELPAPPDVAWTPTKSASRTEETPTSSEIRLP